MPTATEAELVSFQDWTLRVRPPSDGALPEAPQKAPRLLLLLHGWTGDENSMWVFMRNFPRDFWIIAPRGLHPAEKGYSWRPSGAAPHGRPGLENLRPAAQALISLVDAYAAANGFAAEQFEVIGFSQGAVLAATLALLYPGRIRRAGMLAGFMPEWAEPLLQQRPLEAKPVFVAHGTHDETVRVEYARRSVEMLEQAGARVTYCEDAVGHKLGAACLRALEKFFA